ncbi:MAG TPA: trypsin-like peptidase domain-containing protein [Rhodocyclaceae bacterium]|nr:trypsin-like peptidase domain-containing protein [Rhodocyclaceae bacterium]HMZ84555.1 trypsin-like peptidase domain-containing protein [Rhodocyclaceae bacterium]HNA03162.1 trypsin-like peptidase domain-containing protein [Rhodocyclaceae bacterium]HNB79344.1 trypsin-like peptidase domain-containing protein [Rhodocyclaceae bacterium]HNC62634.1 trypsin-like peptidase domain-containing protein [Rhodocyclaceae bacterium]
MRRTSLLLLAACAATPAAAEMDSAFVTQLSISVAKVRAHTAQGKTFLGSGVVVATDEVLTNCHVTRDASSIAVVKGALAYNVYSQRVDMEHDLCLLKTDAMMLKPVPVRDSASLKPGDRSIYYGYTGGVEAFFAEGKVTALHKLDGSAVIETSSGFSLGASGGGLFDEQGRLIGITTFLSAGHMGAYYAMPADRLDRLRRQAARDIEPLTGSPIWDKPESEQPLFLRVGRLSEKKRWDEAAALGTHWTELEPANPVAWFSLGNALSMLARHAEAIAALEKAADLGPGDARVLYALGVALARSGEQTRAETVRVSLAGVDPDMAGKLGQAIVECSALC